MTPSGKTGEARHRVSGKWLQEGKGLLYGTEWEDGRGCQMDGWTGTLWHSGKLEFMALTGKWEKGSLKLGADTFHVEEIWGCLLWSVSTFHFILYNVRMLFNHVYEKKSGEYVKFVDKINMKFSNIFIYYLFFYFYVEEELLCWNIFTRRRPQHKQCCIFRGGLSKLDIKIDTILWQTFILLDNHNV